MNYAAKDELWKQLESLFGLQGRKITKLRLDVAIDEEPMLELTEFAGTNTTELLKTRFAITPIEDNTHYAAGQSLLGKPIVEVDFSKELGPIGEVAFVPFTKEVAAKNMKETEDA